MANIYTPGVNYIMGVYDFMNGPVATDNTFLQQIPRKEPVRNAQRIEMAISRGKLVVAKEVGYGGSPNMNSLNSYERKLYQFPLFKESIPISGSTLSTRTPADMPFSNTTPAQQQAYWITEALKVLYEKLIVTREQMMSQMLIDGKLTFSVTESVNLGRDASLSYTVDKKWNIDQSHTPLTDLAEICRRVANKGRRIPRAIIMSSKTFALMQNSEGFKDQAKFTFSNIRLDIAKRQEEDRGGIYSGSIIAAGFSLDIWTYDGTYVDLKGIEKQFIPDGKVIVGNFDLNNKNMAWYFGATDAMPVHMELAQKYVNTPAEARSLTRNGEIVPVAWAGKDYLEIGLQSAMLCIPDDPNTFGVITVI